MGWPGRAQRPKTTVEQDGEASKLKELTMHTRQQSADLVATIGLDIGKNTFHLVGLDKRGAAHQSIAQPACPPTCQSAALPCRPGGRLWLASHRAPDPVTGARSAPDPGAIREALPQRNNDILLANTGSRVGSPIRFIRGAGRP